MKFDRRLPISFVFLFSLNCGSSDEGGDANSDEGGATVNVGDPVDADGDGTLDGTALDTNGDGVVDSFDADGDGEPDGTITVDVGAGTGGAGSGGAASGGQTSGTGAQASGGLGAGTGGMTPASGGQAATGGAATGTGGVDPGCVVDLDCDPDVLPSTGDFAQDCVDRINQFRVGCHCMEPLTRWTEAEACATANAEFDKGTGVAHSGWRPKDGPGACPDKTGPLSEDNYGRATNLCPGYGSSSSILGSCLKSMYGEGADWAQQLGRNPTQDDYGTCNNSCYSTNGHFIAMTKASHTQVACGITATGKFWSVQNFK